MKRLSRALSIIAFTSLLGGAALGQEEFAGQKLADCAIDMAAHCGGTQPGGGRLVKCLQEKRAEITEECRAAVVPSDFAGDDRGLSITVTVDKIESRQGVVIVMLHASGDKFPAAATRTIITPVSAATATVTFRRLKGGPYAVTATHDLNENSRFEPGEGFAASNGAVGLPTFAKSVMQIDKDASISLSMRYP